MSTENQADQASQHEAATTVTQMMEEYDTIMTSMDDAVTEYEKEREARLANARERYRTSVVSPPTDISAAEHAQLPRHEHRHADISSENRSMSYGLPQRDIIDLTTKPHGQRKQRTNRFNLPDPATLNIRKKQQGRYTSVVEHDLAVVTSRLAQKVKEIVDLKVENEDLKKEIEELQEIKARQSMMIDGNISIFEEHHEEIKKLKAAMRRFLIEHLPKGVALPSELID